MKKRLTPSDTENTHGNEQCRRGIEDLSPIWTTKPQSLGSSFTISWYDLKKNDYFTFLQFHEISKQLLIPCSAIAKFSFSCCYKGASINYVAVFFQNLDPPPPSSLT